MSDTDLNVLLLAGRFQARGSCAYSLRLMQHLPQCGVSVRTVCPDARRVEPERRTANLRELAHLDMPLWGRVVLEFLSRELSASPPDLIHVQSRQMLQQGRWLARRLKRPYVLTMHECIGPHDRLRIDWAWCQRIIAVSEPVKEALVTNARIPAARISVVESGVEAVPHIECAAPLDPGHVPVVGTACPLEAIKGLPYFLSAAQRVLATGRDVEFLVAGAGPEEGNLRRLTRELGLSGKVTFVPYVLDFDDALAAMDIFCLTSLQQGLGTVMLEAMSLGRPVIASGVGGVDRVVREGKTGLVVPPGNSTELARRIQELLDDPVRARALGIAARQIVRDEFGVERMARLTADVYRESTAGQKAAAQTEAGQNAAGQNATSAD